MADDDNKDYQPNIPAAVRRQAARAEELARELADGDASAGEGGGGDDGGAAGGSGDPPADTPEPPPPPVAEPPSDWEQRARSEEQRYRSLQGKYEAETRAFRDQVTALHNLIATMQAPPPSSSPETIGTVIPDEDRETYGDELIAAVGRWTEAQQREREAQHQDEIARLNAQISELQTGQQQVAVSFAQQSVMARLDNDRELRGVWRLVNDDPHFVGWLNQPDPFSGHIRMEMIQDAYARGDAARTGNFFKTYLSEHPEHTPEPEWERQTSHTRPNGNGRTAGPSLERLAAPGRGAATSANGGAQPEKRVWTNTEISAFYRDVTAGKYRSREADRVRIETDIISAASEGRVRQPLR
jgi:hypothetical protein